MTPTDALPHPVRPSLPLHGPEPTGLIEPRHRGSAVRDQSLGLPRRPLDERLPDSLPAPVAPDRERTDQRSLSDEDAHDPVVVRTEHLARGGPRFDRPGVDVDQRAVENAGERDQVGGVGTADGHAHGPRARPTAAARRDGPVTPRPPA